MSQWRIIFLIAAGVYIAASLFYLCFASGEIQPWDSEVKKPKTEGKNIT